MAGQELTAVGVEQHIYYGVCETVAEDQTKDVIIQNPVVYVDSNNNTQYLDLNVGDQLIVTFSNGNTDNAPTFNLLINDGSDNISTNIGSGRIVISSNEQLDCSYLWGSGDLVNFVYTVTDSQSYWKINMIYPAAVDRFGTVRLLENEDTVPEDVNKLAVDYTRLQSMLADIVNSMGLSISNASGEGNWKNITLNTSSNKTITLPHDVTHTGDLINNGDGSSNCLYLTNNKTITFTARTLGMGYSENGETVVNFQPYGLYNDSTRVRVGYGSLLAYQNSSDPNHVTEAGTQQDPKSPATNIYGKDVNLVADKDNGSIKLKGWLSTNDTYDSYADFNKNGIHLYKPTTISGALNATGDATANSFKVTYGGNDYGINQYGRIDCRFLYITNSDTGVTQSLNERIDSRIHAVHSEDFFKVKSYNTSTKYRILEAAANSTYYVLDDNDNKTTHIEVPIGRDVDLTKYEPIGVVGYNVNAEDNGWSSRVSVWECYLSGNKTNGFKVVLALMNHRDAVNKCNVAFDVLYARRWT